MMLILGQAFSFSVFQAGKLVGCRNSDFPLIRTRVAQRREKFLGSLSLIKRPKTPFKKEASKKNLGKIWARIEIFISVSNFQSWASGCLQKIKNYLALQSELKA